MIIADEVGRWIAAAGVVASYAAICMSVFLAERRKRHADAHQAAALAPAAPDEPPVLVAFASQTGTTRELAWQTARSLHVAGVPSRVLGMAEIVAEDLQRAQRALFLVSTYGEGDPPDDAAPFVRRLMAAPLPLPNLHYGLLAIGDRAYANFRGFGVALEQWLAGQGARPLFDRVDVDNGDRAALLAWQQRLGRVAGTIDLPDWEAPTFHDWRLLARRHLNPGSVGNPLFHVELGWPQGQAPHWEAGDLLQIVAPTAPDRPREYSIASLPADGAVHLLVRQERRADGGLGEASGWLTEHAPAGSVVRARLRAHESFRLGSNRDRPLILIGNGSGLAGLLGLLRARAAAGSRRNWLLYGEREAAHDFHHRELIACWQSSGILERTDLVFSRDQPMRRHVQHALLEAADAVNQWIEADAAIYVCGSLRGMAAGVDEALARILSRETVDALAASGRYRRDVY